tara:strand:+ start:2129 stop:2371 length:243 start_codon:yes stop_codon:yes gene_type:complete
MKRKRNCIVGYQKDELLVETTSLNLEYNRVFDLEHNILIYELAKDKSVEIIYDINELIKKNIEEQKYMDIEMIKQLILYK